VDQFSLFRGKVQDTEDNMVNHSKSSEKPRNVKYLHQSNNHIANRRL